MTFRPTSLIAVLALSGAAISSVAAAADFKLSSPSLDAGSTMRAEHYWNNFGCSGQNLMPELRWSNPPAGTQSYAVTFYDKDAPTGSGFWHWVAYDIAANVSGLPGGAGGGPLPEGTVQGHTDLGKPGFLGPCPPVGRVHEYRYTVHALKVRKLPVDQGASPALVGFYIWQNSLGQASLSATAGPRQ